MALTTKLNLINAKICQDSGGVLDLSGTTSVGDIKYLTDKSGSYTARSIVDAGFVTGQSTNLQTQIDYLSGETDLRLLITDFESYTGDTEVTLSGLRTDINTVSGQTDTNTSNIGTNASDITGLQSDLDTVSGQTDTNTSDIGDLQTDLNTVSGQTDTNTSDIGDLQTWSGVTDGRLDTAESDIDNLGALSGITEVSLTGVTNGLCKVGNHDVKLGGDLCENTTIDVQTNTLTICNAPFNRWVYSQGFSNFEHDCNSCKAAVRLSADANGASSYLYAVDSGTGNGSVSQVCVEHTGNITLTVEGTVVNDCNLFNFHSTGITIVDVINSEGMKYGGDYSTNFTNRSIVDKEYVDDAVAGGTGSLGGENGLSRDGDNIVLGGTLTGNTDIDVSTFDLTFTSDSIQYAGDYSGTYVARSLVDAAYVTGLTNNLETSLQSQIDYLSGETDLRLTITDFNSYSASTDTRLDTIESDLNTVSGQTDTNTTNISDLQTDLNIVSGQTDTNTTNITTNATDIDELSGLTINSITGATNAISVAPNRQVALGGTLTGDTEICLTNGALNLTESSSNISYSFDNLGMILNFNGSCVYLTNSGNDFRLVHNSGRCVDIDSSGMTYGGDYSSCFKANTLVDKAYVDSSTGAIDANNGLERQGNNIVLGGPLTGNTTISGTDLLTITAPFGACCASFIDLTPDPTNLPASPAEGMLYYSACTLNFVRDFPNVILQIGEEQVIRVKNNTGAQIDDGTVVYITGSDVDIPTIAKSIASNDTSSRRSVGLVTNDIPASQEGFVTKVGLVGGINTGAWAEGTPLYLSSTVAGGLTNVKPSQEGNNILRVGYVIVSDTSNGQIFVDICCENEYAFNFELTGYTASTETRLTNIESDITTISGQTDTNTTDIADLTNVTDIAITGVTNGLCKVGDNDARLGGTLTQATTISGEQTLNIQPSCNLTIRTVTDRAMQLDAQSNGSITIKSQSGTVDNPASFTNSVGFLLDYDSGFKIYDGRTTPLGIEYNGDYSSNYTNRSLVDKSYVDSIASGQQTKSSVQVATTTTDGNIDVTGGTFASGSTIDSHVVLDGERVLVKNQTDASENGIWVFSGSSDVFYRAEDYDFTPVGEVSNGDIIPVVTGLTNANTQWALTSPDPVAEGDDLNFTLFSKLLEIDEGNGIVFTSAGGATVINVDLATNSGLDFSGGDLTVANEIAGSGLTFSNGVIDVIASTTPATGTEIDVIFGATNNLVVDSDDFQTVTANNGITLDINDNLRLGGSLTGDTTITGGGGAYDLSFNSLDSFNVGFSNNSVITDNRATKCGLVYAGDYKATFVDNSLVSKAYVDCQVTSGVLADNGLTKVGDTIILGGSLTGDTCILHGSGAFYMCNTVGDVASIELDATNATVYVCDQGACMRAGNGTCTGSVGVSSTGNVNICSDSATEGVSIIAPSEGAVYGGDYEANFVDRSLVTKQYVDDQISTSAVTAGVGLTNNANAFDVNITDTTVIGNELNVKIDTVGTDVLYLDSADITNDTLVAAGAGGGIGNELKFNTNLSDELYLDSADITNDTLVAAGGGASAIGTELSLYYNVSNELFTDSDDVVQALGTSQGAGLGEAPLYYDAGGYLFVDSADIVADIATSEVGTGFTLYYDADNLPYIRPVDVADEFIVSQAEPTNSISVKADAGPSKFFIDPADIQTTIGGITGATNGLTKVGNDVCLGGALDNDVFITGTNNEIFSIDCVGSFRLNVNDINTPNFSFDVHQGAVVSTGARLTNENSSAITSITLDDTLNLEAGSNCVDIGTTSVDVTGVVTMSSTLGVTGATTLGSTLNVGGTVTLSTIATGSISTDEVLVVTTGGEVRKVAADTLGEDNNRYEVTGVSNSTINLTGGEYVVLVDTSLGAITVNLPATPVTGTAVKIKDKGNALTNNITISGNGNNVDGSASATINTDYGALELVFDGTDWFALAFIN